MYDYQHYRLVTAAVPAGARYWYLVVYAKESRERSGVLKLKSTLLCYDLFSILKPFLLQQLPFLTIDVSKITSQA